LWNDAKRKPLQARVIIVIEPEKITRMG